MNNSTNQNDTDRLIDELLNSISSDINSSCDKSEVFLTENELLELTSRAKTAARKISDKLEGAYDIKSSVFVKLTSTIRFGDLIRQINSVSLCSTYKWHNHTVFFEMEPIITSKGFINPEIDKLNAPTKFETAVFKELIMKPFIGIFRNSFEESCEKCSNLTVFTNPSFAEHIPQNTLGIVITFSARINESENYMNLYLPKKLVIKLLSDFSEEDYDSLTEEQRKNLNRLIDSL